MKIGEIIKTIDVRNSSLEDLQLLGLSMEKKFINSVANTIGTDMSKYKILCKNQFATNFIHVGRDGKVPIALYQGEKALVSSAYETFEVKDTSKILPEYLFLWFKRSEFDREATFYASAGIRGGFDWEDFINMEISVPSIEEQRRIVAEYQTVERRIKNNEALIQKLEETAQAIYHHTFVEGIDENNLPEGWKKESLYEVATFLNGQPCQKFEDEDGWLPVLKIRELSQGNTDRISNRVNDTFPSEYVIKQGDLIFSWSATLLVRFWEGGDCALNQHLFKVSSSKYPLWFIYLWIQQYISIWNKIISAKATSMGHIKKEDLQNAIIIVPSIHIMNKLNNQMQTLFNQTTLLSRELIHLRKLQSLLTSKLA